MRCAGMNRPSRLSVRCSTGPPVGCNCCAEPITPGLSAVDQAAVELRAEELLGGVVERLLKALRAVHPQTVPEFFALANQHMRWELNDLARRLDEQPRNTPLGEFQAPSLESSSSGLSPDARRMLTAIDDLPEEEREVFGLVRIQGMSQADAAVLIGVSTKTIQRRLNRSLLLLMEKLSDLGEKTRANADQR